MIADRGAAYLLPQAMQPSPFCRRSVGVPACLVGNQAAALQVWSTGALSADAGRAAPFIPCGCQGGVEFQAHYEVLYHSSLLSPCGQSEAMVT